MLESDQRYDILIVCSMAEHRTRVTSCLQLRITTIFESYGGNVYGRLKSVWQGCDLILLLWEAEAKPRSGMA